MSGAPPLEAYAVRMTDGDVAIFKFRDNALAVQAVFEWSTLHRLVDEKAVALKYDGYVPADQVSSLQWRVRELEEQVRELKAEQKWNELQIAPLPVCRPWPLPVPEVTVITDPAEIARLLAADELADLEASRK